MRSAQRRSFDAFPETCPVLERLVQQELDYAEDAIVKAVKEKVTYRFREALDDAYQEVEDAEERINDLEEQVSGLEAEVEGLKDEIANMKRQQQEVE
jgi:predicted  nucleic acid-binding Zn-ribbon protein